MKVLIVTGIFPPDHGGPASYVPMIAEAIKDRGHHVIGVVTLSDSHFAADHKYSFPVFRIQRSISKPLRCLFTIIKIAKLARYADVVYLNGLVLEGIVATKILIKRPVVVKVVGDLIWEKARNARATSLELDEFQEANISLQWRFLRGLQSIYMNYADAIITPSKYLASVVSKWNVDCNKINVIYNAVKSPQYPDLISQTYDVVSVGRLVPWKGFKDLIEVVSELGISLRIVGDGPLRESLECVAKDLCANVSFSGHVEHHDVAKEICSAKLFVLNSSYEGLPHIVLEAKSVGIPVLVSAAGGSPETISHGIDGWLTPVNDQKSLQENIAMLLSDEDLRERLSITASKQMAKEFSLDVQITKTIDVLSTYSL